MFDQLLIQLKIKLPVRSVELERTKVKLVAETTVTCRTSKPFFNLKGLPVFGLAAFSN